MGMSSVRSSSGRLAGRFAAVAVALAFGACALLFGAQQAQAKVVTLDNASGTINTITQNDIVIASTSAAKPAGLQVTGKKVGTVVAGPGYLSISPKKPGTITVQYRFKKKVHKVAIKVLALGNAEGTVFINRGAVLNTLVLEAKKAGKLAGLKVGNKSVLDVTEVEGAVPALNISPKLKKGKSKVTYTFKGKAHTVLFKVRKYANPLASFKVGGGQYKDAFDNVPWEYVDMTGSFSGVVKAVAAKGWQLKSVKVDGKKIANGKKVSKGFKEVDLVLVNKKTKIAACPHLEIESQDSADEE